MSVSNSAYQKYFLHPLITKGQLHCYTKHRFFIEQYEYILCFFYLILCCTSMEVSRRGSLLVELPQIDIKN